MAKQTRRSISVKSTTEHRIRRYAEDHGISRSGFVEQLVKDKLGKPTSEDRSVYDAYMASSRNSSKIGQGQTSSDTSKTSLPKPQRTPAPKEQDDDEPEEMKGYVNPHLTL